MAFDLENAEAETRYRIQDKGTTARTSLVDGPDIQSAIRSALVQFSQDEPDNPVVEFVGDGTTNYPLLANLPRYVDGYSAIRYLEYPAGDFLTDNYDSRFLTYQEDYIIRERVVSSVKTQYISFLAHTPVATEQIRIQYTAYHTLKDLDGATVTTVPAGLASAFYDLCAARVLMMMASRYAQMSEPTINADVVNYADLSLRCKQLSSEYYQLYREAIGGAMSTMGQPVQPPASQWLDWDTGNQFGGHHLFHHGRYR